MDKHQKVVIIASVLLYGFLTLFSYAYVDLNLTLSQNPLIINFVNTMQQLGYFNRPAATYIYILFVICAFALFVYNLWLFKSGKLTLSYLRNSVILTTLILVFAYPFLSSDLFNYLFDAKIILKYHASPYTHRPLDFPQDEWLRFMRWVHRYSPYGPLWLSMSIIPAFLGFGKFILNFLTFKVFISVFHLINTYLIYKILQRLNPKKALFGTAFYALNPLFLIEGVANAHNDIVLATFLILPIYLLVLKRTIWSYVALFAGTLIKYIPVLNLPWLIWITLITLRVSPTKSGESRSSLISSSRQDPSDGSSSNNKNKIQTFIILNLLTLSVFTYLFSSFRITVPFVSSGATQVQFQPWYLFWTIPLIAILLKKNLIILATAISFGASLRYLPFLLYGDWSQSGTIVFMQTILVIPVVMVIFWIILRKFLNKIK